MSRFEVKHGARLRGLKKYEEDLKGLKRAFEDLKNVQACANTRWTLGMIVNFDMCKLEMHWIIALKDCRFWWES